METAERQARAFAATIFTLIGGFAAVVGAHDAFASEAVASRFGGLLLLFAGLALLIVVAFLAVGSLTWAPTAGVLISPLGAIVGFSFASAQLLSVDRDWAPVLCCCGLGVLVIVVGIVFKWGPLGLTLLSGIGLLIAYSIFVVGDHDERHVFWAAIVFGSALACLALWRAKRPEVSLSGVRAIGAIVGFFSLSALIGGAQLWYTSQYLPSSLGASLSVESKLTRLGVYRGEDVAALHLQIRNSGGTKARILGSLYAVTAAPLVTVDRTDGQMSALLDDPVIRHRSVARFGHSPRWDVVRAGQVFPGDSWLEPDEQYSTTVLVRVPRGRYDTLRSRATVLIAKSSALTLDEAERHDYQEMGLKRRVREVASVWPVVETSWFRQLTRSHRELEVIWVASRRDLEQAARFPHLGFVSFRIGSEDNPTEFAEYNNELISAYGLGEAVSSAETPLR